MYLRSHVCPVSYEVDRVLVPLLEMRADRALLVTRAPLGGADRAESFLQRIERGAADAGVETERVGCDISDFHDCLRVVGGLVASELGAGNLVFINISSGGRVLSHAAAVAGMMWDARLYYAEPEVDEREEREFTRGVRSIQDVPTFRIERPGETAIELLGAVGAAGGRTTKKHLIAVLRDSGVISGGTSSRQAGYQALRRVLHPLVERGWLEVVGETRSSRVVLTEEGGRVLRGFGPVDRG